MAANVFSVQGVTFRMQRKWRLFTLILGPLMIGLSVWLGLIPFVADHFSWIAVAILVPISAGTTLWFSYMFADHITYTFTITDNQFIYRSLVQHRYLNFEDVKGFSVGEHYISIETNNYRYKRIEVSRYTANLGEIVNFLRTRFESLQRDKSFYEMNEILANKEFGFDEKSRLERLKQGKRAAWIINTIGVGICIWCFFITSLYNLSLYVAVVFPLVVLALVIYYDGLIKVDERKDSEYPAITFGFTLAICGLAVRVLDFEILDYARLWLYSLIPFAVMLVLFLMAAGSIAERRFIDFISVFILVGFIAIYSACAYATLNCLPDKSEPTHYTAKVLEKTFSKGKNTTYYILLSPWGPRTTPKKVSVKHSEYDGIEVGDEVKIFLKDGVLNLPWFYLQLD